MDTTPRTSTAGAKKKRKKLSKTETLSGFSLAFTASDKAVRRVIAPYVNIVRKGRKAAVKPESDNKYFMFYLQKKPSILMRTLTQFLDDIDDIPLLLEETSETLKTITNAAGVRLYFVDWSSNEIFINPRNATNPKHRISWKIEEGRSLAAYVACKMEYIIIDDILTDPRFPDGIPYTNAMVKSVLCLPIITHSNECYAVVELYRDMMQESFKKSDLKIGLVISGWMGASIHMNQQRLTSQCQQRLNDCLIELTKCYFADTVLFDKMINEIVSFAKSSVNAERTSFFMIDHDRDELVAEIFDENTPYGKNPKIRFGKDRGIAGMVASTGVYLNVKDAYNDPRFYREIDQNTGFITRSILCVPVMGVDGVLGVVQAINKVDGPCFTNNDVEIFKTFSMYCSIALHYTSVWRKSKKMNAMYHMAVGLIKRHILPCEHDLQWTLENPDFYENPEAIKFFSWYISLDHVDEMPQIAYHMIMEIAGEDAMEPLELTKFVLTVRNFYRDIAYHNWEHGFNVCHCMYNLLLRNLERFTYIERKALIVCTLSHDIDHGGVTNNFLFTSNNVMSKLYESSPWESHHYAVTMIVLSEINIYKDISEEEFRLVADAMYEAIIATDLANYFKTRAKLIPIVDGGEFDWDNGVHKSMVKCLMMTACDLSGQCKPFKVAKRITDILYKEFYEQGDMEKAMGHTPLSLMDRDKQYMVPDDQVQFLTVLVLPCCDLMKKTMPNTIGLYDGGIALREAWAEIIKIRNQRCWKQEESIVHD